MKKRKMIRSRLYEVLLDAYNVDQFPEVLQGIITINYDEYIESAIERVCDCPVDFGIRIEPSSHQQTDRPRLLKLHGSFGWQDTWPISKGDNVRCYLVDSTRHPEG